MFFFTNLHRIAPFRSWKHEIMFDSDFLRYVCSYPDYESSMIFWITNETSPRSHQVHVDLRIVVSGEDSPGVLCDVSFRDPMRSTLPISAAKLAYNIIYAYNIDKKNITSHGG